MQPFFLPGAPGSGSRLALHHAPPSAAPCALVLYLHPFAEEMNKSRRMAALQSRALAAAGCAVLQIDLQGCGDSSGSFAEASWSGWLDDATRAVAWLRAQHGAHLPLWLWGLRAGALLALHALPAAVRVAGHGVNLLLWQPPAHGKALLQQFLRLKAAAGLQGEAEAGAAPRVGTEQLRQTLASGGNVDVAGYALAPALASGLEGATMEPPAGAGRCVWIELSNREPAALLPASATRVQGWREAGVSVDTRVVPGPAFWQTQEIEDAPVLVQATLELLGLARA